MALTPTKEGFFKMPLPFRAKPTLPKDKYMAMKRLMSLKTKLAQKPREN